MGQYREHREAPAKAAASEGLPNWRKRVKFEFRSHFTFRASHEAGKTLSQPLLMDLIQLRALGKSFTWVLLDLAWLLFVAFVRIIAKRFSIFLGDLPRLAKNYANTRRG